MKSVTYHRAIADMLQARLMEDELVGDAAFGWGQAEPGDEPKLPRRARFGIWVWIILLGSSAAYEVFAFADGREGEPTLSQIVKGLVRSGGRMGVILCSTGLFGAAVALTFHWGLQVF